MPIRTLIKIFISCPEDVEEEKLIVIEECKKLAKIFSSRFIVEIVEWKQNTVPLITGEGAQSVINDQIKDDYDIYIGILWKHFGVKQANGLTPTEEEFERAFNRYKSTKKPLISVYFKTNDLVENENEQILEVRKFKEKIKPLGRYFDFKAEDFKDKISQDIGYKIENWFSLTSIHLEKPKEEKKNYLQRKVVSIKDYNSFGLFLPGESGDLLDIVEKQHRIVLLGDAGIGKTTELKRIDWYFSKPDSPLVSFFLSLNKYVNQDISELLGNSWTTNPEDRILVILDGLDEIEAKNKNDAIRKIEFFAEKHHLCKILISSRKNFYNQEKGEEAGTINGFLSYVLLDLDYQEIQRYIGMVLGSKAEAFFDALQNGWLGSLLKVPFYLVSLVKLFEQNENKFPESKSQIFEYLLNDRMNLDSNHFHATIDVKVNRRKIQFALQRLGLAMNMLGRNYISEEEYVEIIPTDELRNLLSYCTAWKRNDGTIVTWQFEHNNFQEYLSARALSNKPLDIIRECISFKPEYKRIIPFWVNTLSFLINMSSNEQLLAWIMEIQPELMVKVEPNRIEKKVRKSIFEHIFNEYGQKKTWIPFDKYDLRELARFGQSEETVKFLINEVEKATHYTTCCNAIELLGYSETQFYRDEIRNLLLKVVLCNGLEKFTKLETEQIHEQALIALARLGLNSREVVDQIVNYLVSSKSHQIRYGLYYLIHKSDYLEDYIDIFLEGIEHAEYDLRNDDEIHRLGLSEERSNLLIGLQKARSQESIKKILEYLVKNNGKFSNHSLLDKSLANIAENAAKFAEDPVIFRLFTNLITLLADNHEKEDMSNIICFFDKSNKRVKVFSKILNEKIGNYMNTLTMLANEECLLFFAEQYTNEKIPDRDVWWFQNLLSLNNNTLFLPFNRLINEKSKDKFILPHKRDFDSERKKRMTKDIGLLFNKSQFLSQIRVIFDREQKESLTSDEVMKIMTYRMEDRNSSDLVVYTLLQIAKKQPISISETTNYIEKWDWDSFCISEVYRYYNNGQIEALTKEQNEWIAKWCYSNINKVDFKNALKRKDEKTTTTSYTAIFLWFFLRKLNLSYPTSILLDLLSFDWLDRGSERVRIQYLEDRLDNKLVTERILENLAKGIEINDVLENHFNYCARNKIRQSIPFALSEIVNKKRNNDVRIAALNCLYSLDDINDIENIVSKVPGEFKWTVISSLINHKSENINSILKNMFEEANDDNEKIKLAINLMEVKDLTSLQFYVEWVRKHKKVPETLLERLQSSSPIESLTSIEAIPDLVELLAVSYDQAFQDDIPSLHNTIMKTLISIGLQTDENYLTVKQELLTFIDRHSKEIKDVNFLHSYLDDLERSYYTQKSAKLSVGQIVDFLTKEFN